MLCLAQDFPIEILEAIIDHLPSKKDRRSLWQVSNKFYLALTPRVFETVTIRAKDHDIFRLDSRPYSSLNLAHPLECLKLIEHLHLRAPFREHFLTSTRCPGHMQNQYERGNLVANSFRPHGRLPKVEPLLAQLQENGLLSFSWDLGMCLPAHIFGNEGYLTTKQTAIQSLSLITFPTSSLPWAQLSQSDDSMILSVYPRLQNFSWKGLCSKDDFLGLRSLFASNYKILEDLELDFVHWWNSRINEERYRVGRLRLRSFDCILPCRSNGKPLRFKNLKRLALSNFQFENTTLRISHGFNVSLLQSLKLNLCAGVLTFMATIVEADVVMQLKSLELILADDISEDNGNVQSTLISFLQSFQGLEQLYLMLRSDPSLDGEREVWRRHYWYAINHHGSTLKRLIYHERDWLSMEGMYYEPRVIGMSPIMLPDIATDGSMHAGCIAQRSDLSDDFYTNHPYNVTLPHLDLACFGVSDSFKCIEYNMTRPLAMNYGFKLFHVRKTGTDEIEDRTRSYREEIRFLNAHDPGAWSHADYHDRFFRMVYRYIFDLAMTIFQSPKFEELRILAFGDFSHGGRYEDFQLLLCRAVTANTAIKFKVMSRDDIAYYKSSGVLDLDFLAACPRNELLSRTPTWECR